MSKFPESIVPPSDRPAGTLGFGSSGTSPCRSGHPGQKTVHLIGAGPVGRAFLAQFDPAQLRLVGLTDSTATVHDRAGLETEHLSAYKAAGLHLAGIHGAEAIPSELAIELVHADIVVDATASDLSSPGPALRRCSAALRSGAHLVLASKQALAHAAAELLAAPHGVRVGYNAVLGGTGRALRIDRELLRRSRSVALVPNASTTVVLQSIEQGATLEQGISLAKERGVLEADATLDLDGSDALAKLAIVAGVLWGTSFQEAAIVRQDLRTLDLDLVRRRFADGATTRLVCRASPDGLLQVAYEEVPRSSPLWTPVDRVLYSYQSNASTHQAAGWRVHVGHGIGPVGTAAALHADVLDFVAVGGVS